VLLVAGLRRGRVSFLSPAATSLTHAYPQNFMGLGLPINSLDKVFSKNQHADHTADLISRFGSLREAGRQRPVGVWGGDGSEPKAGTK
jgi:ribonuclease BN (tRNA processing enzyme)